MEEWIVYVQFDGFWRYSRVEFDRVKKILKFEQLFGFEIFSTKTSFLNNELYLTIKHWVDYSIIYSIFCWSKSEMLIEKMDLYLILM